MKKKRARHFAFFNLRLLIALFVFFTGAILGLLARAGPKALTHGSARDRGTREDALYGARFASPSGGVQEAWVARYGGDGLDLATAVAVDGSGDIHVTGTSGDDYATIKYSPGGQQLWVARYDGAGMADEGNAIAVDGQGNVYVTGQSFTTFDRSLSDYATNKYNAAGQEQWVVRYPGSPLGRYGAAAIALDDSGNVYVTGTSGVDYVTIKYNSAGEEQWVARYGNEAAAVGIAVDASGNVYVTGTSYEGGSDCCDYATIKYNSAGQEQWVAVYDGPADGQDNALAIAVDGSGNVCVTGASKTDPASSFDYATVKYNSAGEEQWVARYGNEAAAVGIAVDASGNVYVTGTSYEGGSDCCDYATIKYNSAGQEQWVAVYDGPADGQDNALAIAVDGSGNVCVTGASKTDPASSFDYATVKYNSAGEEQWVARYNGSGDGDDQANAIAIDSSDNVYVTGQAYVGGGTDCCDYATIKYNPAGQEEWVVLYSGPGNGGDGAHAIAIDGSDDVYVTGVSAGSGRATIKYNAAGQEQWVARYDSARATAIAVDGSGNVYVTGWGGDGPSVDYVTIKYVQGPRPQPTPRSRPSPHPRP